MGRRALSVWVVAGEPSGDALGARLLTALAAEAEARGDPITSIQGVGGPAMVAAGLTNPLFPMEELSVMGVWELLPHLARLRRRLHEAAAAVHAAQPDVLITVDSKGFTFRLVDLVRRQQRRQQDDNEANSQDGSRGSTSSSSSGDLGDSSASGDNNGDIRRAPIVCAHYVSPSWWAYRGGEARLKGLKALGIDLVLCLLPFEPPALRAAGIPAVFVGHPVVEDLAEAEAAAEDLHTGGGSGYVDNGVCGQMESLIVSRDSVDGGEGAGGESGGGPVLALLPGSREQELRRHLPHMREMSALLASDSAAPHEVPAGTRVVFLALPQHVHRLTLEASTWPLPATVVPSDSPAARAAAFAACTAAVAAMGTATAQLFAHGVPLRGAVQVECS